VLLAVAATLPRRQCSVHAATAAREHSRGQWSVGLLRRCTLLRKTMNYDERSSNSPLSAPQPLTAAQKKVEQEAVALVLAVGRSFFLRLPRCCWSNARCRKTAPLTLSLALFPELLMRELHLPITVLLLLLLLVAWWKDY